MIRQTTLDNGLLIVTNDNLNVETATISYTVKCGSYNEDQSNRGIAHFTEHMLFKGTTQRNSKQISEAIEGIGGILNAVTSFESTKYYCTVPSEFWETGIDVLSDMIWNNLIPSDEFIKEKQVILEELKMYDDDPSSKIWDLLFEYLHPSYLNRQLVGGTIDSVKKITRDQMFSFIDKFYIPSNMIISACGNISHDDLVAFVKDYCSQYEFEKLENEQKSNFKPDNLKKDDLIVKKDISQSHLCWGIFGPITNSKDYYVAEVICSLLGGNSSSRLYQIIREQKGLAYTVNMDIEGLTDVSILNGYVGLDNSNIDEVKKIVIDELNKLKTEIVNEDELNRTKAYINGSLMIALEKTSSQNSYIANAYLNGLDLDYNTYFDNIKMISSEDIKGFANKYFREDNLCFVQIISK